MDSDDEGPSRSQMIKDYMLAKFHLDTPGKRAVWILFLANLLNYMDRFTVAGVLTHITKEFDLTAAQTGLLQTVFIIAYMIAAPVFGYLGDRYSRKMIMVGGIIVWSISVLCCTFVPASYPHLFFLFRGIVGVGEASYAVIAPSIIADMFNATHRSTMLMFFYIATPFGSGLGYGIGSEITLLTGSWRWGLRLTPILGLFVLFLIIMVLEEPTRGQIDLATFERTTLKEDLQYLATVKTFWLCTAAFTSSVFVIGALSWWTPTIAEHAYGATHGGKVPEFAKANISIVFGIITCAAGLIGVVIGSSISKAMRDRGNNGDHVESDPLICAAGSLLATPLMFLALVFTAVAMNVGWILIFIAVTCMCINWAVNVDIIMYTVMPPRRALASAIQTLVSHLFGDAFSPYLVGLIADSIRGGSGITPSSLEQYTALEYALFVPNFFLILSGAFYLLASFFVTQDNLNCLDELYQGQNRRITNAQDQGLLGPSYNPYDDDFDPFQNASQQAGVSPQANAVATIDPIVISDERPLIQS